MPWSDHVSRLKGDRRSLYNRCDAKGQTCYLTGRELKFPICRMDVPGCEISPQGVQAAHGRALMTSKDYRHPKQKYMSIAAVTEKIALLLAHGKRQEAQSLARQFSIDWEKRRNK